MTQGTTDPESLPVAVWTGTFRIFGVDLVCHVLSDGRRVISAESMEEFLRDGSKGLDEPGDLRQFIEWQAGRG